MQWYASQNEEKAALRRSAARAACIVRSLKVQMPTIGAPSHVVSMLACPDGWAAARLLLSLAIEDARTPGAKLLASQLRQGNDDDEDFARAIQVFVKSHVRFEPEEGEEFETGGYTLTLGAGDCDAHFRLAYAIAEAGGLHAGLGILHHGPTAPPEMRGPAHAVAVVELGGQWVFIESTVDAEFGENPNAAARRLGLTNARSDIAREVKIMTEDDLAALPEDYRAKNAPAQVTLDAQALQRLGYLDADVCAAALSDPTATVLRLAVLAFQRDHGLVDDGLLGPTTRLTIARSLETAGTEGFSYPGMAGVGDPVTPLFTHAQAREALHRAYVAQFGREPTSGELDFGLAVAYFETFYGRGGAAGWANRGQFGRWAVEGKYNWGALESGSASGNPKFNAQLTAAGLSFTLERGSDGGNSTFFYLFPDDDQAARAFLMAWGAADTLAAAAANSAFGVASAMRSHGYYTGFHVGPGKLTPALQEANRKIGRNAWTEEASDAEALRKNIQEYANGLSQSVRTVTGAGGVDNPSFPPSSGASSAASTAVVVLLVVSGLAAIGAAAHHYDLLPWWPA